MDPYPISAFTDNYIWLLASATGRDAIVVDPGQAQPVIAVLEARGLQLSAILLTHHHADHVGGVDDLLTYAASNGGGSRADIPVYGPAGEAIRQVGVPLQEGDSVHIDSPSAHFTVIDVPGHTRGHIAFYQPSPADGTRPPRLFCGDTLFATGCGRLFEGTPAQMLASLDKLRALPAATQVYCAHEYTLSNIRFALAVDDNNHALALWHERAKALRAQGLPTLPTTIGEECRLNPFLRADDPAIVRRLSPNMPGGPADHGLDRLAAFTALRAWKDRF